MSIDMTFIDQLNAAAEKNDSLVCVGLDSEYTKIPAILKQDSDPSSLQEKAEVMLRFNYAIIDATKDHVCAYKPNSAFYEALGAHGIEALKNTIEYIHHECAVPVILDAKRADIGSTNNAYVAFAFSYLGADAITIHPYLGGEAVKPFLEQKEKGIIVLCRTSNPGAGELQDLKDEQGVALYKRVARQVAKEWNTYGNCGLVVGATYPEELAIVRAIVGNMPILVPGIGAQGGDVEKTVKAGLDSNRRGIIVNSSRGVIFASGEEDFAEAAKREAVKLRDEINKFRKP